MQMLVIVLLSHFNHCGSIPQNSLISILSARGIKSFARCLQYLMELLGCRTAAAFFSHSDYSKQRIFFLEKMSLLLPLLSITLHVLPRTMLSMLRSSHSKSFYTPRQINNSINSMYPIMFSPAFSPRDYSGFAKLNLCIFCAPFYHNQVHPFKFKGEVSF